MNQFKHMPDKKLIFGGLLILANRMDTLLERELKEFGVTTKQWFLSIVLDNLFEKPPTLKELAKAMGSSHQNVKQVALKLQDKKLVQLTKDKRDGRVTRLIMTEHSQSFWEQTSERGEEFTKALYHEISEEEIRIAATVLKKMMSNLEVMENKGIQSE